jgi:hypothetical protein
MPQTIRIALALVKEGLPVEIHDAEELRTRLLGMDNMGIIPKFIMNHRASQNFEKGDRVHHELMLPFLPWSTFLLGVPVSRHH